MQGGARLGHYEILSAIGKGGNGFMSNYDAAGDGTRFLMVRRSNPVRPTTIRVVLDWPAVFGFDGN